jgi:S1-C subfamily serine protease
MNRKRVYQQLVYLAAVALLATGCASLLPRQSSSVDTQPIVATVVAQVESTLAQQGGVTSVAYEATPAAAAAAGEAESLQATLTRLYQQANPSVVYIIVSSTSSGSGFVYDQGGYIVTNRHVVAAGNSYEVVFSDGERMRANLVGADADSDLAVLKVDQLPDGAQPLTLADSDVQVGQLVVAIGSPFGEQGSMSLGIVSGRAMPAAPIRCRR